MYKNIKLSEEQFYFSPNDIETFNIKIKVKIG